MSATIACTLAGRIDRAPGIVSFRLLPAAPLAFLPGQYVQVLFDEANPADRELNKFLSLSCAPGKPHLELTKKLSGSLFSQRLLELRDGDPVRLRGPFGDCVLREGDRQVAFLAGGIGITPVISMVEHAATHRPDVAMRLFYSNRGEDDFAFKRELEAWAAAAPNLELHLFLTAGVPRDPRVVAGRITAERLRATLTGPAAWTGFVFGPPPMVEAMRAACLEIGIPETQVRSEGFAGY